MTTLHFYDDTDEILTSSWTARPRKNGTQTEVAFVWGASGFSFLDNATGVYRAVLDTSFEKFLEMVHANPTGIVTLK